MVFRPEQIFCLKKGPLWCQKRTLRKVRAEVPHIAIIMSMTKIAHSIWPITQMRNQSAAVGSYLRDWGSVRGSMSCIRTPCQGSEPASLWPCVCSTTSPQTTSPIYLQPVYFKRKLLVHVFSTCPKLMQSRGTSATRARNVRSLQCCKTFWKPPAKPSARSDSPVTLPCTK